MARTRRPRRCRRRVLGRSTTFAGKTGIPIALEKSHDARLHRLRRRAAPCRMARRGPHRGQFRDQFRGRLRTLLSGRRRRLGGHADRDARHRSRGQGPRPRRREHVRIRLPGRLLAPASDLHPFPAAGDDLRLRPGVRGEPAGGRGDRGERLGHLQPRLSLDQSSGTRRRRGAAADRRGRRADPSDYRQDPRSAGIAAMRPRKIPADCWSSMAGFSTTATPTTTSCRTGCGSASGPISSCPIR